MISETFCIYEIFIMISETFCIYKIWSPLTDKYYIGQTNCIETRWKNHISAAKTKSTKVHKTYIHRAMMKYGVENFFIEVIEETTKDQLNERERFWIAKENTLMPNGYNMTEGGEGVGDPTRLPNYVKAMQNPEYRKKIAKFLKEREEKRRAEGKGHPRRDKCSAENKGTKVKIDGVYYNSIHYAMKALNISYRTVKKLNQLPNVKRFGPSKRGIPVRINGVDYESINEAHYALGLTVHRIKKLDELRVHK